MSLAIGSKPEGFALHYTDKVGSAAPQLSYSGR